MRIPVLSRLLRKRRIETLLDRLEEHEAALRADAAAILELTEPDDDLAVSVRAMVEALDG